MALLRSGCFVINPNGFISVTFCQAVLRFVKWGFHFRRTPESQHPQGTLGCVRKHRAAGSDPTDWCLHPGSAQRAWNLLIPSFDACLGLLL